MSATVNAAMPRMDSMRGMNCDGLMLDTQALGMDSPSFKVLAQRSGLRQPDPPLHHRIDEPVPGVGMALPARFQHVAEQE